MADNEKLPRAAIERLDCGRQTCVFIKLPNCEASYECVACGSEGRLDWEDLGYGCMDVPWGYLL